MSLDTELEETSLSNITHLCDVTEDVVELPLSAQFDERHDPNLDHYEHRTQTTFVFLSAIFLCISEFLFTVACATMWAVFNNVEEEHAQSMRTMWALDCLFGVYGVAVGCIGVACSVIMTPWRWQIKLGYVFTVMLAVKALMRLIVCIYSIAVLSELFVVFLIFAIIALSLYITMIYCTYKRVRIIQEEMDHK
jgi:hypothetical protein